MGPFTVAEGESQVQELSSSQASRRIRQVWKISHKPQCQDQASTLFQASGVHVQLDREREQIVAYYTVYDFGQKPWVQVRSLWSHPAMNASKVSLLPKYTSLSLILLAKNEHLETHFSSSCSMCSSERLQIYESTATHHLRCCGCTFNVTWAESVVEVEMHSVDSEASCETVHPDPGRTTVKNELIWQ